MSTSSHIKPLTQRPAGKALAVHHKQVQMLHVRKLFADDSKRGERLTVEAAGLYADYPKNRITDQTLKLLVQLAIESGLSGRIEAMFSGDKINTTERRAVLHVALRAPKSATLVVDGPCCSASSTRLAERSFGKARRQSQTAEPRQRNPLPFSP